MKGAEILKKVGSMLLLTVLLFSIFLPSGLSAPNTITVYSSHPADIINPIVKEFQERTGISVEVVAAGTGELLKRVQAESANPLGDVVWGGGAESLDAYKMYFFKYKTADDQYIPKYYKDKNYLWTGFTALPMVIMYNKKLVQANEVPSAWKDLLLPKWKGKIACADPAKSGSSYTTIVTILTAYGKDNEKGWSFIQKLIKNLDEKIISSSSAVFKGVADGEYSIGLTYEEAAVKYIKAGAEVGMIYPKEGTSAVPDGVAIIKGAKNLANSKKFVDFVVGKDVQNIVVKTLNRRSIRTDIPAPEGLVDMNQIKMVKYDFAWASTQKNDVLARWRQIVIGK